MSVRSSPLSHPFPHSLSPSPSSHTVSAWPQASTLCSRTPRTSRRSTRASLCSFNGFTTLRCVGLWVPRTHANQAFFNCCGHAREARARAVFGAVPCGCDLVYACVRLCVYTRVVRDGARISASCLDVGVGCVVNIDWWCNRSIHVNTRVMLTDSRPRSCVALLSLAVAGDGHGYVPAGPLFRQLADASHVHLPIGFNKQRPNPLDIPWVSRFGVCVCVCAFVGRGGSQLSSASSVLVSARVPGLALTFSFIRFGLRWHASNSCALSLSLSLSLALHIFHTRCLLRVCLCCEMLMSTIVVYFVCRLLPTGQYWFGAKTSGTVRGYGPYPNPVAGTYGGAYIRVTAGASCTTHNNCASDEYCDRNNLCSVCDECSRWYDAIDWVCPENHCGVQTVRCSAGKSPHPRFVVCLFDSHMVKIIPALLCSWLRSNRCC